MKKKENTLASDPYLGRRPLHALDLFIPVLLDANQKAADRTKIHKSEMTPLQNTCCYIIPNAVQISLSIRELLRSGYPFSAKILLRALVERVLTRSAFQKHPGKMSKWLEGGGTKSRPTYNEMIESVDEFEMFSQDRDVDMKASIKAFIDDLHSVVHTDVVGLHQNTLVTPAGDIRYLSGADHNNPKLADEICQQTLIFMTLLFKRMYQIFPTTSTDQSVN